jgi:hypothetical protein
MDGEDLHPKPQYLRLSTQERGLLLLHHRPRRREGVGSPKRFTLRTSLHICHLFLQHTIYAQQVRRRRSRYQTNQCRYQYILLFLAPPTHLRHVINPTHYLEHVICDNIRPKAFTSIETQFGSSGRNSWRCDRLTGTWLSTSRRELGRRQLVGAGTGYSSESQRASECTRTVKICSSPF